MYFYENKIITKILTLRNLIILTSMVLIVFRATMFIMILIENIDIILYIFYPKEIRSYINIAFTSRQAVIF